MKLRQPTRRRSLLRPQQTRERGMPYWRAILLANLAALTLMMVALVAQSRPLDADTLLSNAAVTITYCTIIGSLIYGAATLVNAFGRTLPGWARTTLIFFVCMIGGIVGSLIAYMVTSLAINGRVELPSGWVVPMLVSNAIVALMIGSVVMLGAMARRRMARRSVLLGQQDLLTAEFAAARAVQQRLLPKEPPSLHGFEIAATSEPAVEVGGDAFDWITFRDGTRGLLVADAAGKGIPAALVMAKFQGMAEALSIHVDDPRELFVGLNDALRPRLDRQEFITVGLMTIDFEDRCRFYRAGHNPALLFCAATGELTELRPNGLALGLSHGNALGRSIEPATFEMEAGDIALLYSDGLSEAESPSGAMFDERRLGETLAEAGRRGLDAEATLRLLLERLAEHLEGGEPQDDVTIVIVRRVEPIRPLRTEER